MHSHWFIKHLLIKAIHISQVNNAIQSVININSELVKNILFMENLWLETRRLQSLLNRGYSQRKHFLVTCHEY